MDKQTLFRFLKQHFDIAELKTLCFELGINHEQIGERHTLDLFITNLIAYAERHGRLPDLTHTAQRLRPQSAVSNPQSAILHPPAWPTTNPFVVGNAIPPALFVGREATLRYIAQQLGGHSLQSVSIVGEWRIGKSSLLRYVAEKGSDLLPHALLIHLDCQRGYGRTRQGFARALRQELHKRTNQHWWTAEEDGDLSALSFGLQDMAEAGHRLVLLLDEVEKLTERRAEFDELLEELRGAGQQNQVGMVTASKRTLADLCRDHGLSSPFYNIFTQEVLGLWEGAEWRPFLRHHLPLTDEELEEIEALAGGHPFYTQLAATALWRMERAPTWREDALAQMHPHWQDQWNHLPPTHRRTLKGVDGLHVAELERRGLLRGGKPFSAAYGRWLETQPL